jgi:5-methylcytosine-specific restriction endonuclease McrA
LSGQLVKGLRYHNLKKRDRTFKLLGYSVVDLKEHLEKQFTPKMNWGNYGSYWHVDHKIPKSFASNEKELLELFALDNLQPLEAKVNISKHNRYIADLFGLNLKELVM